MDGSTNWVDEKIADASNLHLIDSPLSYLVVRQLRPLFVRPLFVRPSVYLFVRLSAHSSDRFRTMVNIFGDAIGAGIVGHLSRDDLLMADVDYRGERDEAERLQERYTPIKGDIADSNV